MCFLKRIFFFLLITKLHRRALNAIFFIVFLKWAFEQLLASAGHLQKIEKTV